ncbi:AAA family ATPase [Candidatus Dependentiae bacterium]
MIPLKLQIKNFLSYGSQMQTINFEPHRLICLSGKNGHGKSALLDAITWALWGQARKISGVTKADDGLLKIGQSHMMVILDFECNNQKYRVKREYGKTTGKPYAALDFGVYEQENKLISLSEKRIRVTQKKIEDTISSTIDTFVNSAFLRQGQANEFSKKSPKDRKEIFAQILGLKQYDFVRKLASDKAKNKILEKDSVVKYQEKIALELEKKDEITKQIVTLEKDLKNIVNREKATYKSQKELALQRKKLTEDQKNKQILQFKQSELLLKEQEKQKKLREIRDKWRQIHKKQLNLPDQTILYQAKNKLIETINKHQKTLQKQLQIKEQYIKNKEQVQKIEQDFYQSYNKEMQEKKLNIEKLNIELQNSDETFKTLLKNQCDKNTKKKQIESEITKLKDTVAISSINQKELAQQEKQFEKRKEHYQTYITQGNWIKKELEALAQKQILSQDESKPSCPLCEQNLSSARKKFLKAKFKKQERFYNHRLLRLRTIIKNLKEILITQNGTIQTLKHAHDKNKLTEVQIKELEKNALIIDQEIDTISKKIKTIKNKQKELSKQIDIANKALQNKQEEEQKNLHSNALYKKLLQEIDNTKNEMKNLHYNEQEHKQAHKELKELEIKINQYDTIRQEIALQKERKKAIHDLCIILKNIKKQKNIFDTEITQYKNLENTRKELEKQEEVLSQNLQIINKQKEELLQLKGALENQISKLKQLEAEHKKQQEIIANLQNEYQDYKIISDATGKNGIQAFLIENAIPEVEQEANHILSRLTNNQAQIFIESLRDLKKGGTKETLDIKISDPAGIRQYELFSGGEAFRIDFALRIAISKLLARRAGTALQTLIIDEGFGSQDEEGLAKIMDAIYKIQDDFSKVIIVSHLSALKDQFPVHFFVTKGPQGSYVKIIQQG